MARARTNPRRSLLVAAAIFVILALLPSGLTRVLTSYAAEPARIALAPPARLFTLVAEFLRPGRSAGLADDEAVREIEVARDDYQRRWRRAEQRIGELEQLLNELQRGRALFTDIPFTPFATPVIARATDPTSGSLTVRGGRDRGITPGAVAVNTSVHLVGRVSAVNARTSEVLPITHRATNWMRVAVDLGAPEDEGARGDGMLAYAQVEPVGEGLLRGELDADAPAVAVGQTVRLADETWPRSAQMLIIGEIIEAAPRDTQPLRTVITVRPVIDPSRVSQVSLWIPEDAPTGETEGAR